ncbi:hypothetical protein DNTS_005587 [Danionella cerebrum]|uniref:BZIP domain-containing protein n=1 Tax=Danionella cerebrum TaxID=2873325 RepID=A0A553NK16_9TELE|nr:hypothetical protein DNTS_005587 [Danionella translucida]
MSSPRDSKCSPQPPNRQTLEKKEAAATPVMVNVLAGVREHVDRRRRRLCGIGEIKHPAARSSSERRRWWWRWLQLELFHNHKRKKTEKPLLFIGPSITSDSHLERNWSSQLLTRASTLSLFIVANRTVPRSSLTAVCTARSARSPASSPFSTTTNQSALCYILWWAGFERFSISVMNIDQDRPFVCTAPGCSQRFQREDHLIIHRHKHEMTLKFPSIKCDGVLSDQTPTPTRFLRDCEEVGLFTDLELNHPQTEQQSKPTFGVQTSCQNQPHQFHQQCALAHMNQNQLQTHTSQRTPACTTSNKQSTPSCLHNRQKNNVTSAINRPKVTPAVSNGNQNHLCHMMEMMPSQPPPLSHLQPVSHHHASYQPHCHSQSPQRLHPHQSQDQTHPGHAHHSPPMHLHPGSSHQNAPPLSHQPIPKQMSCTGNQSQDPQSPPLQSTGRRRRTAEENPDERRRKFLERNRAAATRCRQKRKVWVSSLERKAEDLTHTNLQLQNEVTSLRTEVTQLKQILLAHKDCPVSVRQREAQSGIGSPAGSPAQQHAVQHNNISTSSSALARTHSHKSKNTAL